MTADEWWKKHRVEWVAWRLLQRKMQSAAQQQIHSAACAAIPTGSLTGYIPSMADADAPAPPATPLKEAEDYVALFLNGGTCVKHTHDAVTDLHKLILLKQLRLEMPHQSTNLKDLDAAIRKAVK